MIQDAHCWYTGMTQRDGMGREVGGGFKMGNTSTPMADSSQTIKFEIAKKKIIIISSVTDQEKKIRDMNKMYNY